jgi:hypothetical protein
MRDENADRLASTISRPSACVTSRGARSHSPGVDPHEVVINQSLATFLFGEGDPLGAAARLEPPRADADHRRRREGLRISVYEA